MFETLSLRSESPEKTRFIGFTLANSLYDRSLTVYLAGDLGAGKTLFTQGLAAGLGVTEPVTSPSYALEQRYGDVLTHIDLYRLDRKAAREFLRASEDAPGIRVVEWSQRLPVPAGEPHIRVQIRDLSAKEREIVLRFRDVDIPSAGDIRTWTDEAMLPGHIRKHTGAVARVAARLAGMLLQRGIVVRAKALTAAARLHDVLRFTDFKTLTGDGFYTPSAAETARWAILKETYGVPHEAAAEKYVARKGYPGVAHIIRTHGPHGMSETSFVPRTIEQKLLCYADKRVKFDTVVTLDERFNDFLVRYSGGKENEMSLAWRTTMRALERELFPDGPPVL